MHGSFKGGGNQFVRRLFKGVLWAFVLGAFCLMISQTVRAQEVTAGITGTVTDPSGAPVPDAKVTATDTLRGTAYPTQTNAAGVYDLPRLPVSTYDLSIEAKGFATAVRKGLVLELNQKARIDIPLAMGAVTQAVE